MNRGDHTQIATFEDRPITHNYAGNLADVCPVGALLSHDFRFKMRVWFLEATESVCPGCSTGCNIFVDHRDGEVHRLRPRRNVEVNKSWMCDIGRVEYKEIALDTRVTGRAGAGAASTGTASRSPTALDDLARAAEARPGAAGAFVATPQATNEDLFAFRALADAVGGLLDFRVGNPQDKLQVREDNVLLRADRNPNTQGCLDLGLGRDGRGRDPRRLRARARSRRSSCRARSCCACPGGRRRARRACRSSRSWPRTRARSSSARTCVLPAAVWAEVDGTFTNYQRRVQRIRRAVPPPGDAPPALGAGGARCSRALGAPLAATSAREVFALLAAAVPAYAGLDLPRGRRHRPRAGRRPDGAAPQEARA